MINTNKPIIFFDSGVGGLPYLADARAILPHERFVYLADRQGFPYGPKTKDEIVDRVIVSLTRIVKIYTPAAIVIACNTATELAIEDVRSIFTDIPIIGTVPALKPAAAISKTKHIAIIATEAAIKADFIIELEHKHADGCFVHKIGDAGLVNFVENKLINASQIDRQNALQNSIEQVKQFPVDAVVLGCTHFIHLADEFKQLLGKSVAVIDSRSGVTARLKNVLESQNYKFSKVKSGNDEMFLTGKESFSFPYIDFAKKFDLVPSGTLL